MKIIAFLKYLYPYGLIKEILFFYRHFHEMKNLDYYGVKAKFAIPLIKCANIELKKGSLNKNIKFLHSL